MPAVPAPNCDCNLKAAHWQTKKEGNNKGRWFFNCTNRSCKFFEWDDVTPRTTTVSPVRNNTAHRNAGSSFNNNNRGNHGVFGGGSSSTARPFQPQAPSPLQLGGRPMPLPHQQPPQPAIPTPWTIANGSAPNSKPITVTFSIENSSTLSAKTSDYHAKFSEIFRRAAPDANWDREDKIWKFARQHYFNLLTTFKQQTEISVVLKELPDIVLKVLGEKTGDPTFPMSPRRPKTLSENEAESLMRVRIPEHLISKLMTFQFEGVRAALMRGGRILIGDEMGLGKTIQAISIMSVYETEWPALVICPSSLRLTWKAEIMRWLQIDADTIQVIFNGKEMPRDDASIVIISYDLFSRGNYDKNLKNRFNVVVCDECHYLKSHTSKRTKVITPLVQGARRAVLLSGTPALSRPIELYAQLHTLRRDLFNNMYDFGTRYCDARNDRFGWNMSGSSNLSELNWLIENTVMIRRLKKDVLTQLPQKTRQCVMVDIPSKFKKSLEAIMKKSSDMDASIDAARSCGDFGKQRKLEFEKRSILTEMYGETGKAKIPAVMEYIGELYENTPKKFLVFAHHKEVIEALSDFVQNKLNGDFIRIDGKTNQQQRQALCDKFQNDPTTRIGILGITAAGVGLTLHKADLVIFAELFWNPAQLLQGEDRAHRIGRTECVDIKYILADDTLDSIQWPLIRRKLEVIGKSIDGGLKVTMDSSTAKDTQTSIHGKNSPSKDGDGKKKKRSTLDGWITATHRVSKEGGAGNEGNETVMDEGDDVIEEEPNVLDMLVRNQDIDEVGEGEESVTTKFVAPGTSSKNGGNTKRAAKRRKKDDEDDDGWVLDNTRRGGLFDDDDEDDDDSGEKKSNASSFLKTRNNDTKPSTTKKSSVFIGLSDDDDDVVITGYTPSPSSSSRSKAIVIESDDDDDGRIIFSSPSQRSGGSKRKVDTPKKDLAWDEFSEDYDYEEDEDDV